MPNKILFVSSVNLTLNPRILKEIKLACEQGYDVSFIGFKMGNWSDEIEASQLKGFGRVKTYYISATRQPFIPWLISSIAEKGCRLMYPVFANSFWVNAVASSKRSILLYKHIKQLYSIHKYNMVIAHTLPSLCAAFALNRETHVPFGFDVEDFHPGESISSDINNEKRRRFFLLKNCLPQAVYITAAAPLIAQEVEKLTRSQSVKTVLNYFPKEEFKEPENVSGKIKLVWFSQNVTYGRGLELLLPQLDERFELTLIGRVSEAFNKEYIEPVKHLVQLIDPLKQEALHHQLSKYDAGLALELNVADFNREIALTNKILAYFQAGLYILATDTPAQKLYLESFPENGSVFSQDGQGIKNILTYLASNIDAIRRGRANRYRKAFSYNWEASNKCLVEIWENIPEKSRWY